MTGTPTLRVSSRAHVRQACAVRWIDARGPNAELVVVAPSLESGARLLRRAAADQPAAFGWLRLTPRELADRVAGPALAARGCVPSSPVVLEATMARLLAEVRDAGSLGRFTPVGDRPGMARALLRTLSELRLAGVGPDNDGLEPDLASLLAGYERALREAGLADRATVLEAAIERAADPQTHALLDAPALLFDVPVQHRLEEQLYAAWSRRSAQLWAIGTDADRRAVRALARALGAEPEPLERQAREDGAAPTALERLDTNLFADVSDPAPLDESVEVFSAPGESRECVEVLRRVRAAAADGVPFDRMAVFVHAPERYRSHLVEACRRADVPAYFSRGTVRPDPAGRALLALLTCKAEQLSARAFAEYLSLGVVPELDESGAPLPRQPAEWLPPDDAIAHHDLDASPDVHEPTDPGSVAPAGSLRAPWRWERLLVDAAVIGGADRWRRRLAQLETTLSARIGGLEDPDDPRAEWLARRQEDLAHLGAFALPLLEALEALPTAASWGEWAEALSALAERAIRDPARVLAVLRELSPLGSIGPVGLTEVALVLSRRLTEMVSRPSGSSAGKLFIASTDEARGLSFHTVFVPGLAERVFPRLVREDPFALDRARRAISEALATRESRVEQERLALRLTIGAAQSRIVFGYARLDGDRGRTRVPSFYGLEVLRAIEGRLPSFEEFAARAEKAGAAKMAWPAPRSADVAIDGAEYDLAILGAHLRAPDTDAARGAARYLVEANPHLARALRARFLRWRGAWSRADGLVNPSEPARAALAAYSLERRPYSATALESFAACPYRFYLRSIARLEPPPQSERLFALDRRTRGQLVHAAQFECLARLRDAGLLPLDAERLPRAQAVLTDAIDVVAARFAEELAPAIERVWRDSVREIRGDLSEWLTRMAESPEWVPWRFELAFGLPHDPARGGAGRDPASQAEPVTLEEGLSLRGAIDLVERRGDGALRATDHKTGRAGEFTRRIDGGAMLQPLLYARALEVLFGGAAAAVDEDGAAAKVVAGRLYYSTARGGFAEHVVPLDEGGRRALALAIHTVKDAIDDGFMPAAPGDDECARCDYVSVCGPAEARRVRGKSPAKLGALRRLRKQP